MDNQLWASIWDFDLDNPVSEYGFSTRLANENYWTIDFTKRAILEYKKFMYLAGTSDFMVSPSEVVDTVWHQHLIFTQSYSDFCKVIGKQIQHIPSTHNKDDFEKFKLAKERTKKFYSATFGAQPRDIWEYPGMLEVLQLPKAKFKIRTFIICGILSILVLLVPFYFFLRPIYVEIDNPYFIIGYLSLVLSVALILEGYNRFTLKNLVAGFEDFSFIHHLQPSELVYLKTQKLPNVIHATLSQLVEEGKIALNNNNTLEVRHFGKAGTPEEFISLETLANIGPTYYPNLLRQLALKPIFTNIADSMDTFKKYINKSKAFGRLFYINFAVINLVLMLGIIRLITGILRDRPVAIIFGLLLIFFALAISFLWRLTRLICVDTIPKLYKNVILPQRQELENHSWQYFLLGSIALSPVLLPMVNYVDSNSSSSGSCGTSCGSSCGSSCSSCGGCGGGGD